MPFKPIPPRQGKTPYWYIRGTYLGVTVDRSSKATDRATALKVLKKLKSDVENGSFATANEPTFVSAAAQYIGATGNDRFVKPLVEHFGYKPLREITQGEIDIAAGALYPNGTPATRNRQVYTVVSAILKHAGVKGPVKRPKGALGVLRTDWLTEKQAFALFASADAVGGAEFGIFVRVLAYTGMRLGEALGLEVDRLNLAGSFAYVPVTKNGTPRGVHLPPVTVAALRRHPRGLERRGERVFRFRKGKQLYAALDAALDAASIALPPRTGFHVLRHTWATWMRRFAGLDTRGLVGTGAWADQASASRYEHVVATEEAKRADLLPVEPDADLGISVETAYDDKSNGPDEIK